MDKPCEVYAPKRRGERSVRLSRAYRFFYTENEVGELTFGSFLRVARKSMELTQSEMASTLGVSKSVVCDLEKGRQLVSPRLAVKIARKAGLSEVIAVKLCLQDQLKKAKIKMIVELQAA